MLRYRRATTAPSTGCPAGEGVFLPCSFWLADALAGQGRHDEARELFERLLDLRNDVGLLSEEYDPSAAGMLGNFPQAFTHLAVVNTAMVLGHGVHLQSGGSAGAVRLAGLDRVQPRQPHRAQRHRVHAAVGAAVEHAPAPPTRGRPARPRTRRRRRPRAASRCSSG